MTQEVFDAIKSNFDALCTTVQVAVFYHGGEPLLNPRIVQMVRDVRFGLKLTKVKIVSNGMLLNSDVQKELINAGINEFEISLDGKSAEENERIRVGADTEKILSNLCNLLISTHGTHIKVNVVNTQVGLSETGNVWLNKAIVERTGIKPQIKSNSAIKWPRMGDRGVFSVAPRAGWDNPQRECSHVNETITVRADGTVVPCCYDLMTDLPMGNVLEKTISEIWHDERYLELRHRIADANPPKPCSGCAVLVGGQELDYVAKTQSVTLRRQRRTEMARNPEL